MPGRNLKIATKLTISAAVFLLPLGIMLFSIISISLTGIQKSRDELKGVETLRPAMSLMQIVPLYIMYTVDSTGGDAESIKQYITNLLNELTNKYEMHFSKETIVVSPQVLSENWNNISNTTIRTNILWSYSQFIQNLYT